MAGVLSGTVWLPDGSAGAGPGVEVTACGPLPPGHGPHPRRRLVLVRADPSSGYYTLQVRDTRPGGTGSMAETRVWLQPGQSAR